MKLYNITHSNASEDGSACYGSLKEAKKEAHEIADDSGDEVEVTKYEFTTDRANLIRMANGRGWVNRGMTVVYTARPKEQRSKEATE